MGDKYYPAVYAVCWSQNNTAIRGRQPGRCYDVTCNVLVSTGCRTCHLWTTGGYPPATRRTVVRPRNIPQRRTLTYLHQRYETITYLNSF